MLNLGFFVNRAPGPQGAYINQLSSDQPVCDRMWICRALSLPRTLRQRRHRCLKMVDDSSPPASAALSDCRITVTFGGLPTLSHPVLAIIKHTNAHMSARGIFSFLHSNCFLSYFFVYK